MSIMPRFFSWTDSGGALQYGDIEVSFLLFILITGVY